MSVYLSICYTNYHLGGAYYDEQEQAIYILNDIAEDHEFTSLSNLVNEVRPSFVIASRAQDSNFLRKLRTLCNFNVPERTLQEETVDDTEEPPEVDHVDVTSGFTQQSNNVSVFRGTLNPDPSQNPVSREAFHKDPKNTEEMRNSSSNHMIISTVKNVSEEEKVEDDEEDKIYAALSLMPFISFDEIEAKKRINALFSQHGTGSNLMASFRIDFRNTNMIRALGALLRFLDQQRIGVEFDELNVKTPIKAIRTVTIDDIVEIDHTTFKALQIFESEYNPSAIRKKQAFGCQFKAGVSLFNLCNMCRSVPGKQMIRRWFERPTTNRQVLLDRQNAISFFYHDCNLDVGRFLRSRLKDVFNVRAIFKRLKAGSATIRDFLNIYQTCLSLIDISKFIYEREINLAVVKDRMKFSNELLRTAGVIGEVMDFEESLAENRFVVNAELDEELDYLKQKYTELPEYLTTVAKEEAEQYDIESCSVCYVPIIGYLLVLPEEVTLTGIAAHRLNLVYTADGESHYKSPRMDRLDQEIGDIKMQIIDTERSTMIRLQTLILKRNVTILQAVEAAATLDCLLSLATIARELNWHRPQIVNEPIIDIGSARHPLSEITCDFTFVPNPIKSGGNSTKVKLISGPNASGKSVYLKTVGIIAYLTHIGSFVPAESVTIGPINRIVTRMYTIDSVMDGMSSFANDLRQMSGAIRRSDEYSLVIMDEFGKGTMTEVGLSLLASSLNFWLEKGKNHCPHIFASSHFHSLKTLLISTDLLSFHTLNVTRNGDELEFQYKLVEGVIDNSFASYTALKNGISREVINRANEVYEHLKEGKSLVDIRQESSKDDEETSWLAEKMETLMESFLNWDLINDAVGFLKLAKTALMNEDEEEEKSRISEPVSKKFRLLEETSQGNTIQETNEYSKITDKSDRSVNVTFHEVVEEIYFEGIVPSQKLNLNENQIESRRNE